MPLPLDREKTMKLTEELENVIAADLGWFKQFNHFLVCGRGDGELVAAEDAYLRSPFGQWNYRDSPHPLADYVIFQDMADIQQALHACARKSLDAIRSGNRLSVQMHDSCINLSLKLNNKLRHLQLEIIGDLLATDPLTVCYSRRGMLGRLQVEQERAQRIQRPCTLCLIDFDRFKLVNDNYGHPAGDAVLKQGMRYIAGTLCKYDMVFRYGGEECLLCLPGTPLNDAHQIVERIRHGFEMLPITLPDKKQIQLTASFGLAEVRSDKPVEDAIHHADETLLTAKQNGLNRVELWLAVS